MKTIQASFVCLLIVLSTLVSCGPSERKKKDDQPRRIEMLFLGHALEHHNSRVYMPILASALTQSGINITYTEEVEDLNPENLALYDGVIIYANHENRFPEQEKALLDYVAAGHAFLPIHCASFCFNESEEYVDLVGGQFKTHGTDTFTAKIVDKSHPIMQNIKEFSTWDETYVHDKLANDITVLMERVEGEHHEPWTWVKQFGKGKVFYTAYGHDERTWSKPGFQNLIKEGILWAVDDQVKKNWAEFSKDIPTLEYKEMANIPNYEKRDPAPKYQLPLTPNESAKLIQVPSGFKLELFASEPNIINPIAMNWDEKGRLWVIETVDYPNTVRDDKGSGDDRIKICEDTDGDGKADKFTVFAENLNIPTSFTFVNGGILVSQAPYFLFLKDSDGDDKADIKEVVMDGWGVFDTHAGPSNLQRGIDNNIYGVVGYSGFKGNISGENFDFGQGIYRFNSNFGNFEFLTNTSNNTWGLGITEDNSIFASTANNTHSVFMGIPNKNLKDVKGISLKGSSKIDGHYAMLPITQNIRQVDVFGGFTAAAGHHFYTARTYPEKYWNKYAFVCEPTGGVVHIAKIETDGAGYLEKDGGNLMASSDEWFSPVEAKVGPDGAVWVLDWYNFIIQHNPTPNIDRGGYDAVNGLGNAYENPLRDKSKGRIWRIVPKDAADYRKLTLDREDSKALLKALYNDNMFWRMTAQRLLVENGNTNVVPELIKLVSNTKVDALGLNPGALHALWTLDGLGVVSSNSEAMEVVKTAVKHPSAAVRKAAIQILPKSDSLDALLLEANVLMDNDPGVQLAALIYFSEREPKEEVGQQLFELSRNEQVLADDWLAKALYAAGSKHHKGFITAFQSANPNFKMGSTEKNQRQAVGLDDSQWKTMLLPQFIEDAGLQMDGIVWFRRNLNLPSDVAAKSGTISLGPIDDSDKVYVNGELVGATEKDYQANRVYQIPSGILKEGKNSIAVRVEDTGGGGGIWGKKEQMFLKTGQYSVSLAGDWRYEVELDYSNSAKSAFADKPLAQLLVETYINEVDVGADSTSGSSSSAVTINIKTIKNEMKYDITEFVVETGKPVELVFENTDFMQHNLVITKVGEKEKVGMAADKLAMDPNGAEKNYVPEMPEVLFATAIINPEEKVVLKFIAPEEPGDYPFICTFPGHWRIMQGVMKVVKAK
ncbi:putative membrane-bound dehydrogenase domain-containing protein [Arenibacter palladensis]|uniref:Putative membrane-bound dehydrogenase domain-containing protein n=1 Tax=Arenibacter palladensis TaxID=237373 RepID=A0A1M5FHD9_9FLAO|nr:PVC-type heme-binding CxxCH protein [Arenibacter palladensis]SHF90896.1 putative membrane-bound dehydrogenase domain-containing protein [Arenibacter palladensis]